ncbi:MAG TPA: AMP-binding protein [Alphaproteobacteria bacterium]|nr:AMP-binding protein [Alphaproteobacteria bacterium]
MTLAHMLAASTAREPDATAIVDGTRRLTYGQWWEEIQRLAGGLQQSGLVSGDHLVAVLSNRLETASLYWACQTLGVIFTPFNWRASGPEIAYVLEDAEAQAIVYEARSADAVLAAAATGGISVDRLIYVGTGGDGVGTGGEGTDFTELAAAAPFTGALPDDDSATSLMLYTSGTTGRPKGVPRSYSAERMASLSCLAQLHYRHGEVSLGVMPLFHTMGVRSLLMSVFLNGNFVCLPAYHCDTALGLVQAEKISALFLVPTMFHDMVHHPDLAAFDLASVRNIAYAGMTMTTALVASCARTFPDAIFSNFYGSSEIYTFAVRNDLAANPASAGRAGIGQILRVVRADPDERVSPNEQVPVGQSGEIIASMSAPDAFKGYWKRPDADEKAIRDGWYFTGDLGRFDENGEIYVLGRVDDMINSGGENIYAEEVEDVLAKSPDVLGVAVIGLEDERWGERVAAFIEPASPDASPEALDQHCLDSGLARFKRPRSYAFVRAIPRSASGKLLRRHLRTGDYELLTDFESTI